MVTPKAQSASTAQLSDEVVWLAACVVAELGFVIAHDGQKLPTPGAAHLASETADDVLVEFQRRFRR